MKLGGLMNTIAIEQTYSFLVFVINGILIGILFDIFRILRKSFQTPDIITYIEDSLFWILAGLTTLIILFRFNDGELRLYTFLGIILGVLVYMLTLSKLFIKINVTIITFLKNIFGKMIKILIYPFECIIKLLQKIFFRPFSFIIINFKKIISQLTKSLQKVGNKAKNMKNKTKKSVQKKDFNI